MNEIQNVSLDVLGRTEIITSISNLIELLSNKKSSCCFSIDGGWGVGKSFILDSLVEKINSVSNENKIEVFRYDCWKYDYYDEPIVSIVSVLLDEILSNNNGENTKEVAKELEKIFVSAMAGVAQKISGIDFDKLLDKIENEKLEVDSLFLLQKEIEKIRKILAKYSENHTIVLMVDELDRCLPKYSIKVLERLHHIFYGIDNIIIVIALDGNQLEYSVKNIFGRNIDYDKYIKKFIDFRIKVDEGHADESIFEKYNYFFGKYSVGEELGKYLVDMIELSRLDIRSVEKIISKIEKIDALLNLNTNSEIILCVEFTIELLKEMGRSRREDTKNYKILSNNLNWFSSINSNSDNILLELLGKKMRNYLVDLKKSIISNTIIVNGVPADKELIDNDPVAVMYLVIDNIFESNKLFLNNNTYQNTISECKKFLELSRIID